MTSLSSWLVGGSDSEAVRCEYETALEVGKPVLAFVAGVGRSLELDEFVRSIGSKYAKFEGPGDLYDAVRAAVSDEVIRGFRSAVQPKEEKDARALVEALAPPQTADIRDVLNCVIFGIEDQPLIKSVFEAFGGMIQSGLPSEPSPPFEDIHFTHPDEANDIFGAVSKVVSKAKRSRGDRQKAFERALTNEVTARASHFAMHRAGLQPAASAAPPPLGFKYMIFRVHRKYASIIRLLRTQEIIEGPIEIERNAEEVLFEHPTVLQGMDTVWREAQQKSDGNPAEYIRLLMEGAMHLQILGPDALSEDD